MDYKKLSHSVFLIILAIFINVNIVDDRFVSPLEDLSHQYQSYELEETTRVLSIQNKKQDQISFRICFPSSFALTSKKDAEIFPAERNHLFSSFILIFHLLSLPPPTLV
ncbi:hypothetical protein EHQ58_12675 [Leptospira ognonensis]|uniref:Uncharacterized protein n=1 Tax=Leptospira ognonensis TaxID=2484945 RepID=A0A4V3JR22_9LEPT|nr:hypothetical protein [Leptospira ognonensis]TGL58223.1 hypothetical protein EHQ58_12675 [Leptospira ognonensis]